MAWTEKQQQAIDIRGKNILVSAAAGSGKTSVLTERIKNLVLGDEDTPGVPISELLIVTYTEAAAAEMKQRIEAAISEKVSEGNEFAISQLRGIGSAKISTFHAFALSIVKKYYHAIDLDPSFGICDESRASFLENEAMDALFDCEFEKSTPEFIDFLNHYGKAKNENAVRDMIISVRSFIMTLPNPFEWLEDAVEKMGIPSMIFADKEIRYQISVAKQLLESINDLFVEQGFENLLKKNNSDMAIIEGLELAYLQENFEEICNMLDSKFETFRASKDEKGFADYSNLVKLRRDRVKKMLKELRAEFFKKTKAEYEAEINHTAPFAKTLKELVIKFDEFYSNVKREDSVVDFDDLQHMALKILEDDDIAKEYQKNLRYIFIDEYQDSNYIQEALINRIRREDNVFMVGDVKQSIYKFQNAEPALILSKYNSFPSENILEEKNIKIDLSSNFRSKAGVINSVNAIFTDIMEEHYSDMKYDDDVALSMGLSYDEIWDKKTNIHIVSKEIEVGKVEGEALVAADIIKDTVGKPFFDTKKGITRDIEYRDIVIILRAAKNSAETIRDILEKNDIPAYTGRGEGYFETTEIDTFLSILGVIDNLRQDVPLVATMFSAVFDFEMSELVEIRLHKKEKEFYSAFLSYVETGKDEDLKQKCLNMMARIDRWRDEERFMRLDDFLWKLMRECGYYDYAGALLYGEQRQANLRAMLDIASSFQNDRVRGLHSFLAYVTTIKDSVDMPQVKLLAEGENVVRIMTIHKSKGLEFPVVIQCGLGDSLVRGGSSSEKVMCHRDIGIALDWEDYETHTYKKTLLSRVIKQKSKLDERAEAIRLLYVAMTRAMDTLHLIGTIPKVESYIESYEDADPAIDIDFAKASSFFNLIMPTVMKQKQFFEIKTVSEELLSLEDEEKATPVGIEKNKLLEVIESMQKEASPNNEIAARFEYEYPFGDVAKVKSKYSVTSIVKMGQKNNSESELTGDEYPRDNTIEKRGVYYFTENSAEEKYEDAGLTAAEKGTAVHKALELLDFREAYENRANSNFFETFIKTLVDKEILTEIEANSVSINSLMSFSRSKICERAAASLLLRKEIPFNMKMPYSEISASDDNDCNEEIIVQGIIDCVFEEDGELVLVDYKTGYYSKDNENEEARIKNTYASQIKIYEQAVNLVFNMPVKQSIIYMVSVDKEIEF